MELVLDSPSQPLIRVSRIIMPQARLSVIRVELIARSAVSFGATAEKVRPSSLVTN